MNAVVSGHSGVAVLVEGDRLSSIHTWDYEVLPRRPGELRLLFNDARDLQFLEDVTLEQVRERLDLESTRIDALHTALILLDSELSHDTRRTAAEELEEDLADERLQRWVEGVLYAHPLPKSGDIPGGRAACTGRTERVRAFLDRLESLQGTIAEVHEAWQRIPESYFGSPEDRQHTLSVAVKEGFFRDLVTARAAGRPVDSFLVTALLNPAFKQIRDARHILLNWVAEFRKPKEPQHSVPEPEISYVAEPVFITNREQRTPCILVLDISGSMNGEPIHELNRGLKLFEDEIKKDEMAVLRCEVALVTFGESVELVQDFVSVGSFTAPVLKASGDTPLGSAMNLALDSLRSRKDIYKQNGINYTRPWLFLISDGAPTDSDWQVAAQRARQEEAAKRVVVFPIGVGEADVKALGQFSSKNSPLKLQGFRFAQLFQWLSCSQQRASTALAGESVQLPPTNGWAEVET